MIIYVVVRLDVFVSDACLTSASPRSAHSTSPWAISRLNKALLAGDHFSQDLSDRIKLCAVNKWVGSRVEKCYEFYRVIAIIEE